MRRGGDDQRTLGQFLTRTSAQSSSYRESAMDKAPLAGRCGLRVTIRPHRVAQTRLPLLRYRLDAQQRLRQDRMMRGRTNGIAPSPSEPAQRGSIIWGLGFTRLGSRDTARTGLRTPSYRQLKGFKAVKESRFRTSGVAIGHSCRWDLPPEYFAGLSASVRSASVFASTQPQ